MLDSYKPSMNRFNFPKQHLFFVMEAKCLCELTSPLYKLHLPICRVPQHVTRYMSFIAQEACIRL